jgi:hypothetical protein
MMGRFSIGLGRWVGGGGGRGMGGGFRVGLADVLHNYKEADERSYCNQV